METDDARFLPEFGVVHAWTSRDKVIIEQMVMYLARKRLTFFVGVEELETKILNSTDAEGIVGASAWSASEREGRRMFVAKKTKEATLVATVKQHAMMRAVQDKTYQELFEVIERMNEWQENLCPCWNANGRREEK